MNVACLEKMLNCGNLQKKPKPIFFMGKYLMKKLYIGGIPQAALAGGVLDEGAAAVNIQL